MQGRRHENNYGFMHSLTVISYYRYYAAKEGIFIISASIRVIAESLISSMLFTRTVSASSISGNIAGIYSGLTKSDHQNEVTFTIAGTIQLASGPLALYLYMQNAGKFRVLQGSRISVALMETKYPAFHVTLDSNVSQDWRANAFLYSISKFTNTESLKMTLTKNPSLHYKANSVWSRRPWLPSILRAFSPRLALLLRELLLKNSSSYRFPIFSVAMLISILVFVIRSLQFMFSVV